MVSINEKPEYKKPGWQLRMEVYNAPVGKADYILSLTQKRVEEIKQQLLYSEVKESAIEVKYIGESKFLSTDNTEKGQLINSQMTLIKL